MNKILLISVLVFVTVSTFIHGSAAGCCSCKSTFNDLMKEFSKKVQNEFDSVSENGSTCTCPPCNTIADLPAAGIPGGPPKGTLNSPITSCPHLHPPTPADGVCRKFVFKDTGPELVLDAPFSRQFGRVVAKGHDLFVVSTINDLKPAHIHQYNRNQYCGLREIALFTTPYNRYIHDLDISDGHIYITGASYGSEQTNQDIWRRPIKVSVGGDKWTKFITTAVPADGAKNGQKFLPHRLKWSKDGEKLFVAAHGNLEQHIYVYDKKGKQIGKVKNCELPSGHTPAGVSFDLDGNIQVTMAYGYTSVSVICLFNKTNYEHIKTIYIGMASNDGVLLWSGIYTHCDGTMITIQGNTLVFMDQNYKITNIARNLAGLPGNKLAAGGHAYFAVTSDGYLNVVVPAPFPPKVLYKYKLY